MSYLLDTDFVIDFLHGRTEAVALVRRLRPRGLSVSTITIMEIIEGIEGGRTPQRARRGFRAFMRKTRVLVVSRSVAERSAAVRLDLRRRNRQVNERTLDIMIASTAIEHGLTLVTRNRSHFVDINDLLISDQYPPTSD